jgi:two-component system response regulator RegA
MTESNRWLLIDDDDVLLRTLARSLERRDQKVSTATDRSSAMLAARANNPQRIVLDLKLGADNGLNLISELKAVLPRARIVLLTGYASIATAVEAIRRGAWNYLPKPIDLPSLLAAFEVPAPQQDEPPEALAEDRVSLKQLEWEHIQRVLAEYGGNVSAAARALGMYRRTLQRKLGKKAPG